MSHYITLPSNSSMQYFPCNTLTNYNTKIIKSIIQDDSMWEVAPPEISFPKSWVNIVDGENEIYSENTRLNQNRCLTIPVKRYSNNFGFFHALKECFTLENNLGISVNFNENTGHIIFYSPKGSAIFLTGKLVLQTGFESDVLIASKMISQAHLSQNIIKSCCMEKKFNNLILSMSILVMIYYIFTQTVLNNNLLVMYKHNF